MTDDGRVLALLEELRTGQAAHAVMLARIDERMQARDAQAAIAAQHRRNLEQRIDEVEAELDTERGRRKAATGAGIAASLPGVAAGLKMLGDLFGGGS